MIPTTDPPVLDVPVDDQRAYTEDSVRQYVAAWNRLVAALESARQVGDTPLAVRIETELQSFWPRPRAVAAAVWTPRITLAAA
jgi:hypothetical protein